MVHSGCRDKKTSFVTNCCFQLCGHFLSDINQLQTNSFEALEKVNEGDWYFKFYCFLSSAVVFFFFITLVSFPIYFLYIFTYSAAAAVPTIYSQVGMCLSSLLRGCNSLQWWNVNMYIYLQFYLGTIYSMLLYTSPFPNEILCFLALQPHLTVWVTI